MKQTPWTDARIERLKELYATKLSCAQIANEMNCGFSRNSIIGKIARLGLPPRIVLVRAKPKPRERKVLKIENNGHGTWRVRESRAMVDRYKLRCIEVAPRNIPLAELADRECRYIAGDDYLYCGNPQFAGSSYCGPHHALIWVKPAKTWARAA